MSLFGLINSITKQPLNHDQKLRSILRFLRWQIGSRLIASEIIYEWVNGSKFIVKNGETGLTGNIYSGLDEFSDMSFLLHFLRAEDLFADVGSNVGSYTLLACAVVGAQCYAFEPIPSTYVRLLNNIKLNNVEGKVYCLNKGVGKENGNMFFTTGLDTMNHVLSADGEYENLIDVEVVTLDDALSGAIPQLMKIDVEGFEINVLEGAKNILSNEKLHCVIMEINGCGSRYGFDDADLLKLMSKYGFGTFTYDPFLRRLISLSEKKHDSSNILFIRDVDFVVDRIENAPKISIFGKQF